MYALLVLWTVLSTYLLYQKHWKGYIIVATLGMYTQPFMAFVLLAHTVYLFLQKQFGRLILNGLGIFLLFLPWIPTLMTQFAASGPMWMWPIDTTLVTSVLANLYFGYEGTPGSLWPVMQLISLIFLGMYLSIWNVKKIRSQALLLLTLVFVPLLVVLSVSVIKPIYVHRYLIYVTVAEVFLASMFFALSKKSYSSLIAIFILALTTLLNFVIAPYHQKVNLQQTFEEVNPQLTENDVVYAASPLVFYEAIYYTPKTTPVFLYNPQRITPPRYVGSVGMPESVWATTYPRPPKRAFVIEETGTYQVKSKPEQ
jgi:uncharacterized membrane protein